MAAEVNGNSAPIKEDEEPMDITVTHTENYQTLIDAGLPQKVAASLDNIFQTGKPSSSFVTTIYLLNKIPLMFHMLLIIYTAYLSSQERHYGFEAG